MKEAYLNDLFNRGYIDRENYQKALLGLSLQKLGKSCSDCRFRDCDPEDDTCENCHQHSNWEQ